MTATIDALRDRTQKTIADALDQIAAAARTVAGGGQADVNRIGDALAQAGMTVDDFEAAVERARQRSEWRAVVDKGPAAKARAAKAEKELAAEVAKFLAIQDTFDEKAAVIRAEAAAAQEIARDADLARQRLLEPRNVPGALAIQWQEAVAAVREHAVKAGAAETSLAEAVRRVDAIAADIESMSGTPPEKIDPTKWKAPEGAPEWHRDGHHGELESRLRTWRERSRVKAAAETEAKAARATHTEWVKRRDAMTAAALDA